MDEEKMSQPLKLLPRSDDSEATQLEKATAISELFDRARRGDIPRGRPLHSWEPDSLNERHCQAIMMRCMGMKQKDIAIALGYTDATVSIVLNHPDATFIIDQLQGFSAVPILDIEGRLKRLTPKALDAIEAVFDDDIGDDPKVVNARVQRARMGFSLLEHNGHGKKSEVKHDHQHSIAPASAALISRALRESREIENAEYSTVGPTPGGGTEGSGPPTVLPPGTEAPPLGGPQETY
jgi:hypothetical protein